MEPIRIYNRISYKRGLQNPGEGDMFPRDLAGLEEGTLMVRTLGRNEPRAQGTQCTGMATELIRAMCYLHELTFRG